MDAAEEVASLDTAEEAIEEAMLLEEEPQAARTPAALTAAMAVINERREIFFMKTPLINQWFFGRGGWLVITNYRAFYQIHVPLSVAMATAAQIYVMVKMDTKTGCALNRTHPAIAIHDLIRWQQP